MRLRRLYICFLVLGIGTQLGFGQGKSMTSIQMRSKKSLETPKDPYEIIKERIRKLLSYSETYLGTPYRLGGTSKRGIDCSAFTRAVYNEASIELPRVSRDQAQLGSSLTKGQLMPGDLIFFATGGGRRVSHVGIIHEITNSGEVKFIHASSSQGVTVSSLEESYWSARFLFGKRLDALYTLSSEELSGLNTKEIIKESKKEAANGKPTNASSTPKPADIKKEEQTKKVDEPKKQEPIAKKKSTSNPVVKKENSSNSSMETAIVLQSDEVDF